MKNKKEIKVLIENKLFKALSTYHDCDDEEKMK